MIPHGNLKPNFCTSWPILFLLKNALLDENLSYFTQEKYSDYIKHYAEPFYTVQKDVETGSKDEWCAEFCLNHKPCDFITTDKTAFDEILSELKKVKSIKIEQILEKEPTKSGRPVYSLSFRIK